MPTLWPASVCGAMLGAKECSEYKAEDESQEYEQTQSDKKGLEDWFTTVSRAKFLNNVSALYPPGGKVPDYKKCPKKQMKERQTNIGAGDQ